MLRGDRCFMWRFRRSGFGGEWRSLFDGEMGDRGVGVEAAIALFSK